MFKLFKKLHSEKVKQLGGIEEKKEAIKKTNDVADRINRIVNEIDVRFHDVPVGFDRRKPV